MTEELKPGTTGDKADLIISAKQIMIHAPYPLGWQFVANPERFSVNLRSLDKLIVSGEMNGTVSLEVKVDD